MKKDKIIKQHFEGEKSANPPSNLDFFIMEKIHITAEKKQKHHYIGNILLVALVSVGIICGGVWLLKEELLSLWNKFLKTFSFWEFQDKNFIEFCMLIASIALLLLLLDMFIRKKFQKYH